MMTDTDRPAIQFVSQESALDVFLKLKERPAYALTLLCFSDHPLTRDEITGLTGWGPNQVRAALAALEFHSLATQGRERGPWSATQLGRSLYSQQSSTAELQIDLGREAPRGFKKFLHPRGEENTPPASRPTLPDLKLARFDSSSTVELQNGSEAPQRSFDDGESSTVELSNLGSIEAPQRSFGENGKVGSHPKHDWLKVDLRRKQRLIACRQLGINPPALTRIVENDGIDPIYIFAHAWQVSKQGGGLGLTVYRVEKNFSASKEAMRHAEAQMSYGASITCQHCHWRFSVTLALGEEASDYTYGCPKCGQDTDDTKGSDNGHQPEEEQSQ